MKLDINAVCPAARGLLSYTKLPTTHSFASRHGHAPSQFVAAMCAHHAAGSAAIMTMIITSFAEVCNSVHRHPICKLWFSLQTMT